MNPANFLERRISGGSALHRDADYTFIWTSSEWQRIRSEV
jgi:hypothetical protein